MAMKFILLFSLLVSSTSGKEGMRFTKLCSSSVCIPSTYNKMDTPISEGPLEVGVSLMLLDIYGIDYLDFTMDLNLYMRFSWIDNRVSMNNTENVDVDVNFIHNLWVPDIYIYDLKTLQTRKTIRAEEGLSINREDRNTKVTYGFEAEVVIVCPIDYSEFPFNSHICNLKIGSSNHPIEKMKFVADHSRIPGQMLNKNKIRDYKVNVSYLGGNQTKINTWAKGVYFSVTGLQIELESIYDKYIYIYYIPTTMFTLTSWVSFMLPPTCYPARTTLLVTVFLCQIGVFNAVIRDTPNKDGGE
jgi:hypothetical protein